MRYIVGIDEAGRGPLAGPVSVGVVCISNNVTLSTRGLTDSKKLSEKEREVWFEKITVWQKEDKLRYAVSLVSNTVIDKKGIVYAVKLGMKQCLKKLNLNPKHTLILLDGALRAPEEFSHQRTIIKGDEKVSLISLASIVAKVTRDKKMKSLAKRYPKYGFEVHKGYGTLMHMKTLGKYGLSPVHRRTFLITFFRGKASGDRLIKSSR